MNVTQLKKDHPKLKLKDICINCGISQSTITKLKKGTFKGELSIDFFLRFKKWKPEVDLKKYFPEYKELIELEIDK